MAKDSRQVRKIRRIKRERSKAFRLIDVLTQQRDQAREVGYHLSQELNRRDKEAKAKLEAEVVLAPEDIAEDNLKEMLNVG